MTVGSSRKGAPLVLAANFEENSPKDRCWLFWRTRPKVAMSQNAVLPPWQRRQHGVLGHRNLRPRTPEEPAPVLRRVLLEVRREHQGRALPRRPDRHQERAGDLSPAAGRGGRRRLRL